MLALIASLYLPAARAADGAALFAAQCAGCHQAKGEGVEGMYPPLMGLAPWLAKPEGRAYVAQVITHGLFGGIEVGGKPYNGGFMPTFSHLSDDELLAVLGYVAEQLNTPAKGYSPIDAAALEAARKSTATGPALKAVRDKLPPR